MDALVEVLTRHSRDHAKLQAVIFNCCGGVTDDTFKGLLASGVAVVAAPGEISDQFCIQYTHGFYKALALCAEPDVADAHCSGLTRFRSSMAEHNRPSHGTEPILHPALLSNEWQWSVNINC